MGKNFETECLNTRVYICAYSGVYGIPREAIYFIEEIEVVVAQGHKCATVNATVVNRFPLEVMKYLIFSFSSLW